MVFNFQLCICPSFWEFAGPVIYRRSHIWAVGRQQRSPAQRENHHPTHSPHVVVTFPISSRVSLCPPSPVTDIPDQLLAEIFLRLPTPQDLARASAVCVTFRRISKDRSFLRCFRCLHAPPLLGFLGRDGFHPALPSTPAVRALAVAADFTFSFLPHHRRWTVQDVRDGRVLLSRTIGKHGQPAVFRNLAVCDPLHRRYVLLPPLPHDLAASLEHPFPPVSEACWGRFLVPLGEEEAAAGETTFRVILMAHCKTSLAAFVFSSSTDQWQATGSKDLSDLALDKRDVAEMSRVQHYISRRHYAYDCFYWDWVQFGMKKLLLLDTTKMEFSIADLPLGEWSKEGMAIVEAGGGRLGIFGFRSDSSSDLSYIIARTKGENPSQWQVEKTISLDSRYKYFIRDATQRYLFVMRRGASSRNNRLVGYFSMDIKTLQLHEEQHYPKYQTYTYINFPPSVLSSRRI